MKVALGEHIVTASSADGSDSSDLTVSAVAAAQNIPARMDLLTKRNQRLQAEAVERQRTAQAQAAEQRQQQVQQQQAAQAEVARLRTQPQPQALTPAITSPCQIPALPQVWRNVANNGRYRFRIDCEHADVYEAQTNRIVCRFGHEEKQVCRHEPAVSVRRQRKDGNFGYYPRSYRGQSRNTQPDEPPMHERQFSGLYWLELLASFIPEQ